MQVLVAQGSVPVQIPAFWVGHQTAGNMAIEDQVTTTSDQALLARIAAGDEQALGALYDRYGATLYALAYAIVRDSADAEEGAADAFAQVWRSAAEYDRGRGSVAAWLTTITRSRGLDRLRAKQRRAHMLDRASVHDEEGLALPLAAVGTLPDGGAEQSEVSTLVNRSLGELPQPQRRVIEMAYFGGLSQSEIASELNEPLGTVKTRMRAGMQKLRESLRPWFGEVA